LIISDALGAVN